MGFLCRSKVILPSLIEHDVSKNDIDVFFHISHCEFVVWVDCDSSFTNLCSFYVEPVKTINK